MERVHRQLLLLIIGVVAFSSHVASSDGRTANLGNQSGGKHGARSQTEDQTRIPSIGYPYPGKIKGHPEDLYGSFASMYFPASAAGFQNMEIGKDSHRRDGGVKEALNYGGYPYGNPPFGYGYQYPGVIFGFPGGIFGFPGSIFRFPRGIFGFPGGLGGFPGGLGGFPGGPGGYAGGYGGNPGVYGGGRPGNKPDGPGYPGYGGNVEVKGKEVNHHD